MLKAIIDDIISSIGLHFCSSNWKYLQQFLLIKRVLFSNREKLTYTIPTNSLVTLSVSASCFKTNWVTVEKFSLKPSFYPDLFVKQKVFTEFEGMLKFTNRSNLKTLLSQSKFTVNQHWDKVVCLFS